MDDAEYIFREDIKEKKKAGRGASHKVRGGGRWVRTPSDSLSWKERQKMNGEVVGYKMNSPVGWKEFRQWPDDIQAEYVRRLQGKYGVQAKDVAQMFSVTGTTFSHWSMAHGVVWPRRGKDSAKAGSDWYEFLGYIPAQRSAFALETVKEQEEPAETPCEESAKEPPKATLQVEHNNIAAILAMLVGTGAKLTIEVTL